jgi:RNA polymerase sigma factor (sigma-70 family)
MLSGQLEPVLRYVRHVAGMPYSDASDSELLERYLAGKDEIAFATLVHRHGGLVRAVCRRGLANAQDAEDAFQATFMVFASRASSICKSTAIASWLHGVAFKIAMNARRARRRRREEHGEDERVSGDQTVSQAALREIQAILDEEVSLLAEKYRSVFVLCCLQGKSKAEAARELGWKEGTVSSRLARARKDLQRQLTRRGVALSSALCALSLSPARALEAHLVSATVAAVISYAAGHGQTAVSTQAVVLAEGTALALYTAKFKLVTALVFAFGCMAAGFGLAGGGGEPAKDEAPRAPAKTEPALISEPLPEGAIARLGSAQLRVGDSALALTPDGKTLIAMSTTGNVIRFDAQTGKEIDRRALGDRRTLHPNAFGQSLSADGSTAVVISNTYYGLQLTVWDVTSGTKLLQIQGTSTYSVSPNGNFMAVVEYVQKAGKSVLRVYDLRTRAVRDIDSADADLVNLREIRFTPDGRQFLAIGINAKNQASLFCFDMKAAKLIWEAAPVKSNWYGIAPDGRTVVACTGATADEMRALDIGTGKSVEGFKLPSKYQLADFPALVADGRTLLLQLTSGEVAVWDYRDGREVRRLLASEAPNEWTYRTLLPAPDGKTAYINSHGLRRWDLASGRQLFGPTGAPGHARAVQALVFLDGGKTLASLGRDETLLRWELATGQVISKTFGVSGNELWDTRAGLRTVDGFWSKKTIYDPATKKSVGQKEFPDDRRPRLPNERWRLIPRRDGQTSLTYDPGAADATVTVFDYVANKTISQAKIPAPAASESFQAFSPCGRWLVAYGNLYDVASGERLRDLAHFGNKSLSKLDPVTFSADGRLLCGRILNDAIEEEFGVWEVATGATVARFPSKNVGQVAFSTDGRTLAYVTGWGVHVLDLANGEKVAEYEAPDINCESMEGTLAFSPDARLLATGQSDGSILIWKAPPLAAAKLTEKEAATLWNGLGAAEPKKALLEMDQLVRSPDAAIAVLAREFKAAPAAEMARLIGELDSPKFATRDQATRRLRELGMGAAPALRKALQGASPEMERGINQLLDALGDSKNLPVTGETLRAVRAVAILERIGTARAKALLQEWAESPHALRLTIEARLALEK